MLDWRNITSSRDPKYWTKGTEIDNCIPAGFRSRFMVIGVRAYDAERYATQIYVVRDVERISDAQVRAGVRPPIVGRFDTLDEALEFIEPHRVIDA